MKVFDHNDVSYTNLNTNVQITKNGYMMKYLPRKRKILCTFLSFVVISTVIYYFLLIPGRNQVFEPSRTVYSSWPQYSKQPDDYVSLWQIRCFSRSLKPFLSELESNMKKWNQSSDVLCKNWYRFFSHIYSISFRIGNVKIPKEFLPKVKQWLNNNDDLMKELHSQHIIHIFNEFTREHSTFSPLRAKRPQSKPKNVTAYVERVVQESAVSCDFCHYETRTSEDIFGRIKTNHSVSAANTFKVDRWHSLIIPFRHHPLQLTEEETIDMFEAASLWFKKVHSMEENYKYPWLLWDSMPHAGASQVHTHVHVGLNADVYVGMCENFRFGAEQYFKKFRRNYFADLASLHGILGLSVSLGDATAIAQLTSKKDTEITILSPKPGVDFYKLIFHTIKAFYSMGLYDFSSLTVLPIMTSDEGGSLPAMMRIASRGDVSSVRSEISSFELFQFSNINVDPYDMIKIVRDSLLTK